MHAALMCIIVPHLAVATLGIQTLCSPPDPLGKCALSTVAAAAAVQPRGPWWRREGCHTTGPSTSPVANSAHSVRRRRLLLCGGGGGHGVAGHLGVVAAAHGAGGLVHVLAVPAQVGVHHKPAEGMRAGLG